jgi:hypothetical protein
MTEALLTDHDILIELRAEIRGIKVDIKDLKDGTSKDIFELQKDVLDLQQWRISRIQEIKDKKWKDNFIISIALLILGMVIFHLTGYHL